MNSHDNQKTEILEPFGHRIRMMRHDRRWSQEELASQSGLARTYIGGIERAERNISLVSIDRLAKTFGVTLAELFTY